MKNWKYVTYFKPSEFDSPDEKGSGELHMQWALVSRLDLIRERVGFAMHVNSGYRTSEHNATLKNSSKTSQHLLGNAADIHCTDSYKRRRLIEEAIKAGIKRIIIYPTFLHMDMKAGEQLIMIGG